MVQLNTSRVIGFKVWILTVDVLGIIKFTYMGYIIINDDVINIEKTNSYIR